MISHPVTEESCSQNEYHDHSENSDLPPLTETNQENPSSLPLPTKEKKTNVDLLQSNIFHTNDPERKVVPWIKLSPDERADKLKDYLDNYFPEEGKQINNTTKKMLIDMAKEGKLKLKKEIKYDEVNERVVKINVLLPESTHSHNYIYKPETLTKSEKSRKAAKTKLFRRKKKFY
jgi:hypothetical protein